MALDLRGEAQDEIVANPMNRSEIKIEGGKINYLQRNILKRGFREESKESRGFN